MRRYVHDQLRANASTITDEATLGMEPFFVIEADFRAQPQKVRFAARQSRLWRPRTPGWRRRYGGSETSRTRPTGPLEG